MNLKTIAMIATGVAVSGGVIVGMNMVAAKGDQKFTGGVTPSQLPRELPNANLDPFQVVDDQGEAARRATANREQAHEAVAQSSQPSYTAPPVIHREGSSGDAADPMASALVDQTPPLAESKPLAFDAIEPVVAPRRDYKVPKDAQASGQTPAATGPAAARPVDPMMMEAMRRAFAGAAHSVVVQTFDKPDNEAHVPMVSQRFSDKTSRDQAVNTQLPHTQLPEQPAPQLPVRKPAITLPDQAEGAVPRQPSPLRTIDPNTPSSYVEGALIGETAGWPSLARAFDPELRQPYQLAQLAVDNNGQVYDTARNSYAYDVGSAILAGDQRYATLMYGFNSDDAAQLPVFAQLHDYSSASSAYLNGARLQGTLRLARESGVMEFDKLILRDGRVIPISAMAISVDQGRVGVADKVNRHVLERYSSLLVAGLISGIGNVGERIIDNRYDDDNGVTIIVGDNASASEDPDSHFTDADRAAIAMGAVKPIGDTLASSARKRFDRKPTVTAPAGFGLSVVFLEGLSFSQLQ